MSDSQDNTDVRDATPEEETMINTILEQRKQIEELEEKLLSATMDGQDMAKHEYRDRIEELEAKLAKAVDVDLIEQAVDVELIEQAVSDVLYDGGSYRDAAEYVARTILAELKGQDDD